MKPRSLTGGLKDSVLNAIAFLHKPGRTHTADALTLTRQDMFSTSNGDRTGEDNIVILMTDGFSNINAEETVSQVSSMNICWQ